MQLLCERQPPWEEMIRFFASEGFELWATQTGFSNPETGQTLQFDGISMRRQENF